MSRESNHNNLLEFLQVEKTEDLFKWPMERSQNKRKNEDNISNDMQIPIDSQSETNELTPDIESLFRAFDDKFFCGTLKNVKWEWSNRMNGSTGLCYQRRNLSGKSVIIRLNELLLKLQNRFHLIETLLHEMIHAYLFVKGVREANGGHGPNYKRIMETINRVAGTNITVHHTLGNQVDIFKSHIWRCNGICRQRMPFYGWVKRTSNRAPDSTDYWWSKHNETCKGKFVKVSEPKNGAKKSKIEMMTTQAFSGGTCQPTATIVSGALNNVDGRPTSSDKMFGEKPSEGTDRSKGQTKVTEASSSWDEIDDDILIYSVQNTIIEINDDANDECLDNNDYDHNKTRPTVHSTVRVNSKNTIKRQLLNELDENDFNIEMIDNEFDDMFNENIGQSTDSLVIDDVFDAKKLMTDFNDVNNISTNDPTDFVNRDMEIVKCPICEDRTPRFVLSFHLNECENIRVKTQTKVLPFYTSNGILTATTTEVDSDKEQNTIGQSATEGNGVEVPDDIETIIIDSDSEDSASEECSCPVCNVPVVCTQINQHLDICLQTNRETDSD